MCFLQSNYMSWCRLNSVQYIGPFGFMMHTINIQRYEDDHKEGIDLHFVCLKKFWRGLVCLCFFLLSICCKCLSSSNSILMVFKIFPIKFWPGQKSGKYSIVQSTSNPVPHLLSEVTSAISDLLSSKASLACWQALNLCQQMFAIISSSFSTQDGSISLSTCLVSCLISMVDSRAIILLASSFFL